MDCHPFPKAAIMHEVFNCPLPYESFSRCRTDRIKKVNKVNILPPQERGLDKTHVKRPPGVPRFTGPNPCQVIFHYFFICRIYSHNYRENANLIKNIGMTPGYVHSIIRSKFHRAGIIDERCEGMLPTGTQLLPQLRREF